MRASLWVDATRGPTAQGITGRTRDVREARMRSIPSRRHWSGVLLCSVLVLLAACGPEERPTTPKPEPAPVPTVEPEPDPPVDPEVAFRWVEDHVAAGWFPAYSAPSENEAGNPSFGVPMEDGEEVEYDADYEGRPAGEVPPDSREPSDRPPPPRASAPTSPAPTESSNDDEVVEEQPRYGGVELEELERLSSDGVAAFTGVAGGAAKSGESAAPDEPTTWRRSSLTANATKIAIGDDESLALDGYEVVVRVDGHRARVVLDLTFDNPHEQVLEGRFKLRVPDGASVHFLAFGGEVLGRSPTPPDQPLSIDTPAALLSVRGGEETLRPARMVPKEQAQRAYAAETARQIDPALLEWSGAGVFSARLFPIQPGKSHRVTVAYDLALEATPTGRRLDLVLPDDVAAASARIDVSAPRAGEIEARVEGVEPRVLMDGTRSFVALNRPGARLTLELTMPDDVWLAGLDDALGPCFAATIRPEVPKVETPGRERAVFLVDTSMSSNPARMNLWLDLLRATLDANRDVVREFAVLHFDVERRWWRTSWSPNDAATVGAYLEHAREIALEGATDLSAALTEGVAPAWHGGALEADVFLYSDGAGTWGEPDAARALRRAGVPVYAYSTSLPGTDTSALREVARNSGGALFAVTGPGDVAQAARAHRSRPWTLRSVSVAGAMDILVAGRPDSIHPGQRLRIAGRGVLDGADIVCELEQGSRRTIVVTPVGTVVSSGLAPRAYGELATSQLEALSPLADDVARAYAIHHRVTGKTCSLLMLESEEAYERYEIRPKEEAIHVRMNPVTEVVSRVDHERAMLQDAPRGAFKASLARVRRVSGVQFDDLDRLLRAAGTLPEEAFEFDRRSLASSDRSWGGVDPAFQEQLAAAEPTYAAALAEAERRLDERGTDDAIRALSCLVEADPGAPDLLRDVALTLLAWDRPGEAVPLLRRVVESRPHEPETYRALAGAFERLGRADLAALHYEICLRGAWDARFGAVRLVAAMDYLRLLRRIERGELSAELVDLLAEARKRIESDYLSGTPDLVVTLTWNTDRTDVDLHVVDPSGEECFYSHPRTKAGGAITQDVTQGYGPEMFVLGHAPAGEYVIRAKYFSSDALRRTLRSRVYATVIRNCGREDEEVSRHALLVETTDDVQEVVRLRVE